MYTVIVTDYGLLREAIGPFDTHKDALAEADELYAQDPNRRYQVLEIQQPIARSK
jgi:hypothetical protein